MDGGEIAEDESWTQSVRSLIHPLEFRQKIVKHLMGETGDSGRTGPATSGRESSAQGVGVPAVTERRPDTYPPAAVTIAGHEGMGGIRFLRGLAVGEDPGDTS
jgi:hypothetical protein